MDATRDLFGRRFPTTVMDPPWPEQGAGKIKRGADRHYPLIKTLDDIARTVRECPIWAPADDAHLYIWATNNYLLWGCQLFALLGFEYITALTWVKMEPGNVEGEWKPGQQSIGRYFRGETEQLLFGRRGNGMAIRLAHTDRKDLGTAIYAPVPRDESGKRIHSRKPDESYRRIEAASPGPYAEIFARRQWGPQWSCWGNESLAA